MIPVTKPFLPPRKEYDQYIDQIWERNWLTNDGPLVQELEKQLITYLGLPNIKYVTNGTIALQLAIKALKLKGEIITTPFSYVATTTSIVWEGCKPVYVDIDKDTFNINPDLIVKAITSKTTAILATHVFGNPCNIDAIDKIAKKHNLKVIYDASHCFGTKYKGQSVLNFGDISTISFHATKLFHTVEGGGVVAKSEELMRKIGLLRNFGHNGPENFNGIGINGKSSEFHAAMGLVNLKYADSIMIKRKADHTIYDTYLTYHELKKPKINKDSNYNFAYYPVVFQSEKDCLNVFTALEEKEILARRYFYPVLSQLDYVNQVEVLIAQSIAKKILCLPLFEQISKDEIHLVCDNI
ncbi:MAG: DegT/DnrJ/EryC1/StrS family aminotransferase [Reichenbachiella sp.]